MFQNAMAVLQSELQNLRIQFEESLNSHENAKKSLTEQVRELNQHREHSQLEVRTFENLTFFQSCTSCASPQRLQCVVISAVMVTHARLAFGEC